MSTRSSKAHALAGFLKYVLIRGIVVLLTVGVGVYIALWVSQLGGYADGMRRSEIRSGVAMSFRNYDREKWYSMTFAEQEEMIESAMEGAIRAAGLHRPFILRSFGHLAEALSLSLGEARGWYAPTSISGSRQVRDILLESMPFTLLLFGTANLLTFFLGLIASLLLASKYQRFIDRLGTLLIPLFSAPPWFHGILLILIFAVGLRILPYGGIVDAPVPQTGIGYALSTMKHMILPSLAWMLGTLPAAIYAGRALFLIRSTEDFVEQARAKGLRERRIQRRYILRPVLPSIVTNFVFLMLVAWQGAVLVELVFNWPGLGRVLFLAIGRFDVGLIMGGVVVFAYLLALTVLVLDIVYAALDPRVRLNEKKGRLM